MKDAPVKKAKEALRKFLVAWKQLDHQGMYDNCNFTWSRDKRVASVAALFPVAIDGYRVKSYKPFSSVVYDAIVVLSMDGEEREVRIRMLREEGAYIPSEKGTFGVNPSSIRKTK